MIEGAVVTPNVTGGIGAGAMSGTHNVIRNNIG